VHFRVTAPPFLNPCYYGTDIDSRDHLIACHHSVAEIAQIIGVDSLGYLDLSDVHCLADGGSLCGYCDACFSGNYTTEVPENRAKSRFEYKKSERRADE
jgi:amidophosphoribosyltransferase